MPDQPRPLVEARNASGALEAGLLYRPGTAAGKVHAQLLRAAYAKPRPVRARINPAPDVHGRPASAKPDDSPATPASSRVREPVITVAGTGPGQAGYVHYFIIKGPDDIPETQVGIELPDQRIAWAVPHLGVVVSPFIESGTLVGNGKVFEVEHLYGIRPFPDDESMRVLQAEIVNRVAPWIDDEIAYCELQRPRGVLCVSCLGFVMRILFPGSTPEYPALPRDFARSPGVYYTTEDLLVYLSGVQGIRTLDARRKRIAELTVPPVMRDELLRIVNAAPTDDGVAPKTAAARNVTAPRVLSKSAPARPRQARKL